MESNAEIMVQLSAGDRAVLNGRNRFLGRLMKWIYLLLAGSLLGFLVKDIIVYGEFTIEHTKDVLWGGLLMFVSFGAAHAALVLYERKLQRTLRADLVANRKIRKCGEILHVDQGMENDPTRFQFRCTATAEIEEFALHTLPDLARIQPTRLIGKPVEIEYAPISRIVLRLAERQ